MNFKLVTTTLLNCNLISLQQRSVWQVWSEFEIELGVQHIKKTLSYNEIPFGENPSAHTEKRREKTATRTLLTLTWDVKNVSAASMLNYFFNYFHSRVDAVPSLAPTWDTLFWWVKVVVDELSDAWEHIEHITGWEMRTERGKFSKTLYMLDFTPWILN